MFLFFKIHFLWIGVFLGLIIVFKFNIIFYISRKWFEYTF